MAAATRRESPSMDRSFDRLLSAHRLPEPKITSTFIRTALCQSNRPEPHYFTDLNPPQPKPAFSALDRVSPAPTADSWAVRPGPAVFAALARSVGFQVSGPPSAGRYVVGCDFLDLTFYFSFAGLSVVVKLLQVC